MFETYPDLLTRKQVQELLHISKNRMLDYIHSGRIRAMILDGRYLIRKKEVVDFINRLPYA
jgi:excisionase family DNA binding protein|nr:helix-turn-helix domain-containing protein [uncultured Acetatifactor sp.]